MQARLPANPLAMQKDKSWHRHEDVTPALTVFAPLAGGGALETLPALHASVGPGFAAPQVHPAAGDQPWEPCLLHVL